MGQVVWQPQPGPQTALVNCPVDEICYGGARGGGKFLCHTEPVLTPFGWRPHGDLKPGDKICSTDGSITEVIQVYPHKSMEVFEYRFNDGTVIRGGIDHNWYGWKASRPNKSKGGGRSRTAQKWTGQEVKDWVDGGHRFYIPLPDPSIHTVAGTKKGRNKFVRREIDPYLLGLLIGDGYLPAKGSINITSMDDEIAEWLDDRYEIVVSETSGKKSDSYRFVGDCRKILADQLDDLGLLGKKSDDKFIPRIYLFGSVEERRALLQGLMDTDGWAEEKRAVYYTTVSEQLANDVRHLVGSLGGTCTTQVKTPSYTYNGERKQGKTAYTLRIKMPDAGQCFRLSRKQETAATIKTQAVAKYVVSVESTGEFEDMQCIEVRHPNSLYITRNFTITHNTDGMLGKNAIKAERYGKHQNAVFFRRQQVELEEAIERAHEIYQPLGWHWQDQKKTYTAPNGARLKFRYLERDSHAMLYQGHSYTDVYIEEAGNFPRPDPINKLRGTLRSGHGVPCQLHLTCNPGGPGHQWVKARYIEPDPSGMTVFKEKLPGMKEGEFVENHYVFIPAKLKDNNYLGNDYVAKLRLTGSEQLVRAWLEGDWDIVDGAFFDCWHDGLVIPPFMVPEHWTKLVSFDWGSAKPFSVGWWAVVSEDYIHYGKRIPKGALVRYREWYGAKTANVGLKMTADEVGKGIRDRTKEHINYYVADPAIFNQDGGPSIAERMKVPFFPADNKRLSTASGKIGGWDAVRERMVGDDGTPMIYFFNTCKDSIRTIPVLQHDETNPEDLDTDGEDHCADEVRYACMSRPWTSKLRKEVTRDRWDKKFEAAEREYLDGGNTWRTL